MLDDLPRVLRRVSCGGLLLSGILTSTACDPVPIAVASAAARGSVSAIGSAPRRSDPAALAGPVKPGGRRAVRGEFGMVSSADARATRIGAEVLSKGGNAIDAAVAVGYALSVTHFTAGSLGGGGFMIVRRADGQVFAVDYREKAPAAATLAKNDQQLKAGAHGYLSAPVPGVVAGLNLARRRFGTRPLAELIAPSIALA
ncbi:MAG: gamma-glutamyltransferase, partial [Polyangiaceae bacterium]